MEPLPLFILFLLLGLLLFGLELFVPGGILGTIGGILLLSAMVLGFSPEIFGPQGGILSAALILVGVCVYIGLVFRFLPRSPIGRAFTLSMNMKGITSTQLSEDDLLGQTGTAHTDLRPSGIAIIGGRRVDVIAEGNWIHGGAHVIVLEAKGNRVVVRENQSD